VNLGGDFGFKYKGDIFVFGVDVPGKVSKDSASFGGRQTSHIQ
jgi:hypothetical protein